MDADADLSKWTKAFEGADADAAYLDGVKTNEEAFRALMDYLADAGSYKYDAWETVSEMLTSMGYDGITHIGGGRFNKQDKTRHRVYIAFEPEQVKSVDNTSPTTDPDIRYSVSDVSDTQDRRPMNGWYDSDEVEMQAHKKGYGRPE